METKPDPRQETISGFFERDHREIDAILGGVPFETPRQAVAPFEEFYRRLERHIRWEEEILFPAVSRKAPELEVGPLRIMKLEHEEIRRHKASALEALREGNGGLARSHAKTMSEALRGHNMKEEHVLYPSCDQLLSSEEVKGILGRLSGINVATN